MSSGLRVLYLSYDGLTDHIGQSQVLPYLAGCAAAHRLTVISFEKPHREKLLGEEVRRQCSALGIDWRPQRFRSRPPVLSKAMDMRAMRSAADKAVREIAFDLVHCRSYPSAWVGYHLKRRHGLQLLFDMRPHNLITGPETAALLEGVLTDVAAMRDRGELRVLTQRDYCREMLSSAPA